MPSYIIPPLVPRRTKKVYSFPQYEKEFNLEENPVYGTENSRLEEPLRQNENLESENPIIRKSDFLNINFVVLTLVIISYLTDFYFFLTLKIYFENPTTERSWKWYLYIFSISLGPSAILIFRSLKSSRKSCAAIFKNFFIFLPILIFNLEPLRIFYILLRKRTIFNRKLEDTIADCLKEDYKKLLMLNKELATVLILRGLIQTCPQVVLLFSNLFTNYDDQNFELRLLSIFLSTISFSLAISNWQSSLFYLCGRKITNFAYNVLTFAVFSITFGRLFSFGVCFSTLPSITMYVIILHMFLSYFWLSYTSMEKCSAKNVIFSSTLNVMVPPTDKISSTIIFTIISLMQNLLMIGVTLSKVRLSRFEDLLNMRYDSGLLIILANLIGYGAYLLVGLLRDSVMVEKKKYVDFRKDLLDKMILNRLSSI